MQTESSEQNLLSDKVSEQEIALRGVKNRTKAKFSIFLLLLSMLSLVVATFAWFTLSSMAGVEPLELTVTTGEDLRISTENHGNDWDSYIYEVTGDMVNSQLQRNYNKTLEDVTLDPSTSRDGITLTTRGGLQRDENGVSFLQFDLYFIATDAMWVHLSSDSGEDGNGNTLEGTLVTTTETGIKADIVKCTRVSFESEDGGCMIYEPNKGTAVANQTTVDLPTPMRYSDSTRVVHLDDRYEPKKVTVRVWVEGEDPECDNDIQGAQLTIGLSFKGTDNNNEAI
ncbi:MAG: hypothetical protein ACI4QE_01940 [Acutalibacteraceae bacterium]